MRAVSEATMHRLADGMELELLRERPDEVMPGHVDHHLKPACRAHTNRHRWTCMPFDAFAVSLLIGLFVSF